MIKISRIRKLLALKYERYDLLDDHYPKIIEQRRQGRRFRETVRARLRYSEVIQKPRLIIGIFYDHFAS